jgi:endoglucanase
MNSEALEFLRSLLATPTPSGWEEAGQGLVAEYMKRHADAVSRDVHGNTIGVLNPNAPYRVMLAGHCDEIGLLVQHIDEKGFVYVSVLGGMHVPLLLGERILIRGARGPVPGVVGSKPIHLMLDDERDLKKLKIHDLWVDIGAKNRKDAERVVAVGDTATINAGWTELRHGLVSCRGLDDRIGAFVVADTLRLLRDKRPNVAVYAVSTVQEEVGLRGAHTAAFGLDPHTGIAVDVCFASDYPSMDEKMLGTCRLGRGPTLSCGPTYNKKVLEGLQKAAERKNIRVQMQASARGANTDAYAIQMTRAGVAAGLVSVPCRYMHSAVEVVSLEDAEDAVRLLAAFIVNLKGTEKW